MSLDDLALPSLLDFTTLFGAALSIENSQLEEGGLPLSRLLALNQIIEGIVLHDNLCFEWGETSDWGPYRDAIERTLFWRLLKELQMPISPSIAQFDVEEAAVCSAGDWVSRAVTEMALAPLEWAVRFRAGTYDALTEVSDKDNPTLRRYISIIRSNGDGLLNERITAAIDYLKETGIGLLGFHVMMRVRLILEVVVQAGEANYLPHFSRQIVALQAIGRDLKIKRWTMDQLAAKRNEVIFQNEPEEESEPLSSIFSPVFVACLAGSKKPVDILEQALLLRDSPAARAYRREFRDLTEKAHLYGEQEVQLYKVRIAEKLRQLNNFLFERDARIEWTKVMDLTRPTSWIGSIIASRRQSTPARKFLGDVAVLFLSDLLRQSLGVIRLNDKVNEVFGSSLRWDTHIFQCVPRNLDLGLPQIES